VPGSTRGLENNMANPKELRERIYLVHKLVEMEELLNTFDQ